MSTRLYLQLIVCVIPLVIVGCGSGPKKPVDFGDTEEPAPTEDTNKVSHAIGNPAILELWQKAEQARLAGDLETAVTQLERALRINPQDAVMWSRLAEIRLKQGNTNQAENLAAKSNAMSVDNRVLNYRNWLIIANARRERGDEVGAQEAEYTANSYK